MLVVSHKQLKRAGIMTHYPTKNEDGNGRSSGSQLRLNCFFYHYILQEMPFTYYLNSMLG